MQEVHRDIGNVYDGTGHVYFDETPESIAYKLKEWVIPRKRVWFWINVAWVVLPIVSFLVGLCLVSLKQRKRLGAVIALVVHSVSIDISSKNLL